MQKIEALVRRSQIQIGLSDAYAYLLAEFLHLPVEYMHLYQSPMIQADANESRRVAYSLNR